MQSIPPPSKYNVLKHVNLCGKLYVIIISREHQFIMEWILLHLLFIFWICTFDRTERKKNEEYIAYSLRNESIM